jgi:carbonic anhydrase/acetyltransferase-like protein (isoleucine patch superfamily)
MNRTFRRRPPGYCPAVEPCEGRLLLSAGRSGILRVPGYNHPIRPNTPVLPFGTPASAASFIDPSATITAGQRISVGQKVYIAPFANLDATGGLIRVGNGSTIGDNATILGTPTSAPGVAGVVIGDAVAVAPGALITGPSLIGAIGSAQKATYIGPNAIIIGANISAGAYVSALATVGPGVTVPAGVRVLPGANVTTDADASNPALGKVVPITAADTNFVLTLLANSQALAGGYTTLYQGNSATGASPGASVSGVNNGNLATVEGSSQEPGPSSVKFEPAQRGPRFLTTKGTLLEGNFPQFRARVIGEVDFNQRAFQVAHALGRRNSIRADEGQPFKIGSIAQTGNSVTITSPNGGATTSNGVTTTTGQIVIGDNFSAEDGAVILGGTGATSTFGNDVTIGAGAVVQQSSLGNGTIVGPLAYVSNSTLPAGSVVPAGEILINGKVAGSVQR